MSRGTQVPVGSRYHFRVRGYHPLWPVLPDGSTSGAIGNSTMTGPTTPPNPKKRWFGLFRIRSPLLTESLLFSFPPGTKMVHFPGLASYDLFYSVADTPVLPEWVPPFGDPRINACLQLPEAYRSLPRPSSPTVAKASAVCP